jgi:S-adenosylmethionine synthetase
VVDFLEPDAKSQVTLQYENGVPVRATALVVSTQHSPALSNDAGQAKLRDYVKGVFADVMPDLRIGGRAGIDALAGALA